MIWGIIGAMEVEVALIREKMQVTATEDYFGTTYFKGSIGSTELVLVRCGIGKINAAICANTLIRDYKVTQLVNVGIAGSLDPSLCVLDTVISDEVAFHDIDFKIYDTIFPEQTIFAADPVLVAKSKAAVELQKTVSYRVGRVVTGDAFVEDSLAKADIVRRLSPLCVEMEGAAIAQVAYGNNIPFVILRTISDGADDNATETYNNFFDVAAHQSALIVLDLLQL